MLSIVCDFWQPLLYRRVKIARENIFAQMFKFKLVFSANVLSKQVEQNFCANKMACLIYKRYSINLFSKHAKINSSSKHPNLVEEKKPHLGSHSLKQRLEGSSLLLSSPSLPGQNYPEHQSIYFTEICKNHSFLHTISHY